MIKNKSVNRSVDVYRSSPWCCCVGAGPGSSDLLQDKTQKSRVFFWYDPNRPTTVFLHNEPTGNNHWQAIYYTTIYLYWVLSFLSLQTKTKAPMNVQENRGGTASFPPHWPIRTLIALFIAMSVGFQSLRTNQMRVCRSPPVQSSPVSSTPLWATTMIPRVWPS